MVLLPLALVHGLGRADRQARLPEQHLLHRLVDPDRGGQHAGADVGDAGELGHALDRPVLAVGTVQHREHDVDVPAFSLGGHERRCAGRAIELDLAPALPSHRRQRSRLGGKGRRPRGELPDALLRDADRDRLVTLGVERVHD